MKILMLNPPFFPKYSRQSRSPCVTKGGTFYMPYFLSYCCGVLEKENHNVVLIDAVARNWKHEETVKFAKGLDPALIVIDTSTPSIANDMKIADKIKEVLPNSHITLVGTHPTALPNETLVACKADSVCRWEYDYTVRDLAEALEKEKSLSSVEGLSYKRGKRILHNKTRKLIETLDDIPFVSDVYKRHLNIKDYFYASVRWPQVTILTARGCPFNCTFCPSPFKHSYRARSVENVTEEFEYIQTELPEIKEVMIEDETFPAVKQRTIELCDVLIERGIKIPWSCNARVNTDLETLKKMKEAGCRLLCVGFESPEQGVLNAVNKRTTKQMQINFMKDTKRAGLLVNGCFILGMPSDTKESVMKTIEFAKQLNCDTAQFYPLMVYPGTEAYEWAKKNNYLITEDYSQWLTPEGEHNTVVSRPGLTNEDLMGFCDLARTQFYIRPKYIAMKAKQMILHPSEIPRTLKSAKIFFRRLK